MLKKHLVIIIIFIFLVDTLSIASISIGNYLLDDQKLNLYENYENLKSNNEKLQKSSISFIPNVGQLKNDNVRFYSREGKIWFTDDGVLMELRDYYEDRSQESGVRSQDVELMLNPMERFKEPEQIRYKRVVIKQEFIGGNNVQPVGRERLSWNSNFFYGNDSSNWCTNVPNYQEIIYENIYDNIDLKYYSTNKGLKYDFIIHPGAKPEQIRIRYLGAERLNIDSAGDLIIDTIFGSIIDRDLFIYQEINGFKHRINGRFELLNSNEINFKINEKDYNNNYPLIIDPLLDYSVLIGGDGFDICNDIAIDNQDHIYLTGLTSSEDFPTTPGIYDSSINSYSDCYILKLNHNGSTIEYSTYIGGENYETTNSIEIDSKGSAYVVGYTYSKNFPTTINALDRSFNNGTDIFVFKLDPTGSLLLFSTFIGGSKLDRGYDLSVDSTGNIFITGSTESYDFPITNGVINSTIKGWVDCFILKLNPIGSSLIYSTFIGGGGIEYCFDLELGKNGTVYMVGFTHSPDFPVTKGAYDTSINSMGNISDIFISKINHNGSQILYSTFIGGDQPDSAYTINLDHDNNLIITGCTQSVNFPTTNNSYDTFFNGIFDIFVLKLNETSSELEFSTFVGGNGYEVSNDLVLDSIGNVYVTGETYSDNFPITPNANDTELSGEFDSFMIKLGENCSKLLYSTYIGGEYADVGNGIELDSKNNIYTAGSTNSSDFISTIKPFGPKPEIYEKIFIQKYSNKPLIQIKSISLIENNIKTELVYSRLKPYTFKISIIDTFIKPALSKVELILDQKRNNIIISWDRNSKQFNKSYDPNNFVSIDSSSFTGFYHSIWLINFNITFNWSYPHEEMNNVQVKAMGRSEIISYFNFSDMFSVEKNLEFIGDLILNNKKAEEISKNGLFIGNQRLTWTGLTVTYQHASDVFPPKNEVRVNLYDEYNNIWSKAPDPGEPFKIVMNLPEYSKSGRFNFILELSGIPEECALEKKHVSIHIDNNGVVFSDPTPSNISWQNKSQVKIGISITDIGGGMVDGNSIRYTHSEDSGKTWKNWINVLDLESNLTVKVHDNIILKDGRDNLIKWKAKDTLGNGPVESDEYKILVDTIGVEFSEPIPSEVYVSPTQQVEVGVTLTDKLSGVNASSIEYQIITDDSNNAREWTQVVGYNDGEKIVVKLNLSFTNGTENRILWRVYDLAGNGPNEFLSNIIKIDITDFKLKAKVELIGPKIGLNLTTLKPTLTWKLIYNGFESITYDIYLDTEFPLKRIETDFSSNSYNLPYELEDHKKYYWKIVPRKGEESGSESDTWWFLTNKDLSIPIFDIQLILEPSKIEISRGNNAKIKLIIRNLGEIKESILIQPQIPVEVKDTITLSYNTKIIEVDFNNEIELNLEIQTTKETELGEYIIPIEIISLKAVEYGLEIKDIDLLTLYIEEKSEHESKETKYGYIYQILLIGIVIIIVLITFVYNRIEKSNVLANIQRKAIYESIKKNPSIHFRAIMRLLNLKPGTLSYHLNVLEKEGFIKSIQKGEYRCFYTIGTKSDFKIVLSKIQQKIIFIIKENPGISLTELSKALGKNKMVLHYNTHVLEDAGVIKQEKKGRTSTYYVTSMASLYLE